MEFWCVEVKSGQSLKVAPGDGMILHLSQACVGDVKKGKGNESICLFVNVDGKKLVLGTLFSEKLPQQQFDLVFDKDFEISHNWKNGRVTFLGYKAHNPFDEDEMSEGESDESEQEEDIPLTAATNGKPTTKAEKEKATEAGKVSPAKDKKSDAGKRKVKIEEPKKDRETAESDEDMSEDDDDDDSGDEDDSDDSDSETGDSDEETPKKAVPSKKRPAESAAKTPGHDKKAKATPQKTDNKKSVEHVATPYPSKQAGKVPVNKPNQKTPKSGGSITCKSCSRTFGSDQALESHTKAKHAGGK